MTVAGNDGNEYPFKQFVKFVDEDKNGDYIATNKDGYDFGIALAKALTECEGFKYKSKYEFAGDITDQSGPVPWTHLLLIDDVNFLVKEFYGDSVKDETF